MKRQEIHSAFPTGCVSVPLFNQKKRNRVPLTSAPPANESYGDYMTASPYNKAAGGYGSYQPAETARNASHMESVHQPLQPYQCDRNRAAPRAAPVVRHYAPLPHPYKTENRSSKMGLTNPSVRQKDPGPIINSGFNKYLSPRNNNSGQSSHSEFLKMAQQPSYKPHIATSQFSHQSASQLPPAQSGARPILHVGQQQSKPWNFTNSFGPQPSAFDGKKSSKPSTPKFQVKTQPTFLMKPAAEMSLRILTAVIDGMRYWSQFKDKVPYLFEIFATLDSAVTLGQHGAKNFIIRDGKEVVQCVYYENEQELPRLIRGQVHRCVGNFDRSRNVLVCVSIRPALPLEQRNAQEAVKVCDAEMRALVKFFNEI